MKFVQRIFLRVKPYLNASSLAFLIHLPLILSGLPFTSFDAYIHIFFADHYRRLWFNLYEAKWFGGFSVASYPPLVHQLMALISRPASIPAAIQGGTPQEIRFAGESIAYCIVLLGVLVALPIAVEHFARIFVPRRAARIAGWLSVGLPSIYLTAYSFGQLPTLAAATTLLWAMGQGWQFALNGRWRNLLSGILWAGVTAALHHAVLLFAVFAGLALTGQCLLDRSTIWLRVTRLSRLGLFGVGAASFGALLLWPLIEWSQGYVAQAAIEHASRHNVLFDWFAGYYFFWPMYGPLLLVLPILLVRLVRRFKQFGKLTDRHWPLMALAMVLLILGLGGTTPLPAWLFGSNWEWLTYDRFSFWAGLALLPLASVLWQVYGQRIRLAVGVGLGVFCLYAALAAVGVGSQPLSVAVERIATFLNANTQNGDRYITLGFGDQLAKLSVLTDARTVDGTYYTGRELLALRESGIGALDGVMWNPKGAWAIRPFLTLSRNWGVRWAFVANQAYAAPLRTAGWQLRGTVAPGVQLWRNSAEWVSADWQIPDDTQASAADWWGLAPLATLLSALGVSLGSRLLKWGPPLLISSLFSLWPFFYSHSIWTRTYAGVYYTYTSGVLYLADVVVIGLAIMWLATSWLRGSRDLSESLTLRSPLRLAGFALLVFVFVSVPLSTDPTLSFAFGLHLCALCFVVHVVSRVVADLDGRWIAVSLTLGLVIQSSIAILQSLTQTTAWLEPLLLNWPGALEAATRGASVVSLADGARWLRAYGTTPHPNILGNYLLIGLLGPLWGYLQTGRRWWRGAWVIGLAAGLLTFSRAAWVGGLIMAIGIFILIPSLYRRRVNALLAIGVVTCGIVVSAQYPLFWVRATASSESLSETSSTVERLTLVQLAMQYFSERPITGIGAGTFSATMVTHGQISGEPVHNVVLLALTETGLGGAAAVVSLGLAIGWHAWRRRGLDLREAIWATALLGLFTLSLFDHFLWSQSIGRLWFAVVLGCWLGSLRLKVALRVDQPHLASATVKEAIQEKGDEAKNDR
jgi:O-antigen ligase